MEHIPGYSTLISINQIHLKDFEERGEEALPNIDSYAQMKYNNEIIRPYPKEIWLLHKLNEREKFSVSDFLNQLPTQESQSSIEYAEELLSLNSSTEIIDDLDLFNLDSNGAFEFSIDFLYNIQEEGIYICCAHYITDSKIDFLKVHICSDFEWNNSTNLIEYTFDYLKIEQSDEELQSVQQLIAITVLKMMNTEDSEDFYLEPHGIAFFPLYLHDGNFLQGTFQVPIFLEEMNSFIFDMFQNSNPWDLLDELIQDDDVNKSQMSLIVRCRLAEFKGWKEERGDLKVLNTMFMPDVINEDAFASFDGLVKLNAEGDNLEKFKEWYENVSDVLDDVVLGFFTNIADNRVEGEESEEAEGEEEEFFE